MKKPDSMGRVSELLYEDVGDASQKLSNPPEKRNNNDYPPRGLSSLEQVRLAKSMHRLAETMPYGCDAYFIVIEAFNDMTCGEFMKHYLEVNQ